MAGVMKLFKLTDVRILKKISYTKMAAHLIYKVAFD